MPAMRLMITGRVQGVGYREWFRHQAEAAGVTGWVRNRRDGSVEAVIAATDARVLDVLVTQARSGPAMALVENVAVEAAPEPEAGPFRILPTA